MKNLKDLVVGIAFLVVGILLNYGSFYSHKIYLYPLSIVFLLISGFILGFVSLEFMLQRED